MAFSPRGEEKAERALLESVQVEAVRYRGRRVEGHGDDDQSASVADFERAAARVDMFHGAF